MKGKGWLPLKEGDIVDIVAPASRCSEIELTQAIESVKKMGLVPRFPDDMINWQDPLFSHDDHHRLKFLKIAILAKDSKILWGLRGGYGSLRLLPGLSKIKRPAQPKLFIGLSDLTSLHQFFGFRWNWPTVHGSMLATWQERPSIERSETLNVLFGQTKQLEFDLEPMNSSAEKSKTITGPIMGGNLMTFHSSLGTPWGFKPKGHMLFLEEINERGYRLDRMLVSLGQANYFKSAKAILLGDVIGGNEPDGQNFVWQVLEAFARGVKIPVLKGIPSGHGELRRPVPFFTQAKLKLGRQSTLHVSTNGFRR